MSWPPSQEDLMSHPIELLAPSLLRYLDTTREAHRHRGNISLPDSLSRFGFAANDDQVQRRVVEVFDWLLFNGFLAEDPGTNSEYCYVTQRGKNLLNNP